MRQTKLFFMLLLAMIMSATGALAQSVGTVFLSGGCEYKVSKKDLGHPENNEAVVLTVKGTGRVVIPTTVQTPEGMDREWYKVVGCSPWDSKVENGVTEVEFSEGFKEITANSLRKPQTLQKVVIPASCTKVGIGCFLDCPALKEFVVKTGNTKYKAEGGSLLSHDGKQLVYVPAGKSGPYAVPSSVTEIMPSAFSNCKEMTTITVPTSVNKISEDSEYPSFNGSGTHFTVTPINGKFKDINGLLCDNTGKKLLHVPFKYDGLEATTDKLTIPVGITTVAPNAAIGSYMKGLDLNQVEDIGNAAFNSCNALQSVKIGRNVKTIGQGAFTNCQFITKFEVDGGNAKYQQIDGVLFTKPNHEHLVLYPCGKTDAYTVPEGTTTIDNFAFADVHKLPKVRIAKSVKTIGQSAFKGAKMLKTVEFLKPSQLQEIKIYAFQQTPLEKVTIPSSVKKLGEASFADTQKLTEVHFETGCQLDSLPSNLFQNAEKLTKVVFDGTNHVKKICSSVFANCTSLERFTVPKTVTDIGSGAFRGTTGLKTVEFESGSVLDRIGQGAFADCGITKITLPEKVKLIQELAFDHCGNLTEITLPKIFEKVDQGAFNFCENLLRFKVEEGNMNYTTLDGMLCDITKKKLEVFPAGKADSKYTLVPYFEKVAPYCFYGSNKVTNITFPKTVTEIGIRAIALCNNLKSLSFMGEDNVPTLNANIMYQSGNLKNVTIFVRKKWYENAANNATITTYNNRFKEVHPSFVTATGYDRGTEFFPTSVDNVGVISFYEPRTSAIIQEKAVEPDYTDKLGKHWKKKEYTVSSILDFAYENAQTVKDIVVLADVGVVGLKAFKADSQLKGIYFVGKTPATLSSKDYEQPAEYPFKDGQAIYVRPSVVNAYKTAWEQDHTLGITSQIPQKTKGHGGTVCFPFDVKYPSGQGNNDIKPYVPVDYSHVHDASNPFVRAYSLDDYYIPAFTGAFIRSKETSAVTSYCEMDNDQAHTAITLSGYNPMADNRMVGAVEDTPLTNESGYQYYAFKQGKLVKLNNGVNFPYFKAYLRLKKTPAGAKSYRLIFDDGDDDETTGINELTESGSDNAPYYNLNGIRVTRPTQGVYIRNGKKIIIK